MVDFPNCTGKMCEWDTVKAVSGAHQTLEKLSQEAQIYIATGAEDSSEAEIKSAFERVGLSQYISGYFCHANLGFAKGSPEFFPAILAALNCEPQFVTMVGDTLDKDIAPALTVGINPILYNPTANASAVNGVRVIKKLSELSTPYYLEKPTSDDISTLTTWFTTEQEFTTWSGPNIRYPFDCSTLMTDLKIDSLSTFILRSQHNELLAFGQYYERIGRCHFARLVVNPARRGQGIASELLNHLQQAAQQELATSEYSLFVYADNTAAIRAYHKYGFAVEPYPDDTTLDNFVYMVQRQVNE